MGQAPYSLRRIYRPWDDNDRLHQYSTPGQDKFPISQMELFVHAMTNSTTSVLDLRMGQVPYFPGGTLRPWDNKLIDYSSTRFSDGTSSLSPKRIFSSMRRLIRLLWYSIPGWGKFPISKDLVLQEMTIHRLLRTRPPEHTKEENNRLL